MDIDLLIRLLINWIIPGGLAVLVGAKKKRLEFSVVCALLFGALGFFFGLFLGWIGLIAVCCFPRRK